MEKENISKNNALNIEEENDDLQIGFSYDYDNELEKTKSLNKFPMKEITYSEFYIDGKYKNFSKSLNFNSHKCFAPKAKIKQSSKNPTPIIFEKQNNFFDLNLKNQQPKSIEDAYTYSEKELSLDNESSFSSDIESEYKEINYINNNIDINSNLIYNNQIINYNNNNYLISNNLCNNNSYKKNINNFLNKNKNIIYSEDNKLEVEIQKQDNNSKFYEHKTITDFSLKSHFADNHTKYNIKSIRSSLHREKLKSLKTQNKEVEYTIKDKMKIQYGLNTISNKIKKNNFDYNCIIIPINDCHENKEMPNLRKTISFNTSKLNMEKKNINSNKGITIYDVLSTNKINKIEK